MSFVRTRTSRAGDRRFVAAALHVVLAAGVCGVGCENRDDPPLPATTAEPLVSCTLGDPASSVPDPTPRASWRKDFFYPYGPGVFEADPFGTDDAPAYPEADIADPSDGGRVTIVATSAVSGSLVPARTHPEAARATAFQVEINGVLSDDLLDAGGLDWLRIWPASLVEGEPFWIAFHTRDPAFDLDPTVDVRVPTSDGDALDATLAFAEPPVRLTSVVHGDALDRVFVHLHNTATEAHAVDRIVVDGRDATESACLADTTLAPGATTLIEVPLGAPAAAGDPWTVAITFADAPVATGAGRVGLPLWPVETWPDDSDCPFPGVNDENFEVHAAAGYDTFFLRPYYLGDCAAVLTFDLVDTAFRDAGVYAFPDDSGVPMPEAAWDRTPARMLGDEVDAYALDDLVADQRMRRLAEESTYWAIAEPPIATYIGASRSRFTGMFAGVADLQGMDFYTSACAPHVTDFGAAPPLRGAYDYLRAAVRNQQPGPTWLYTQGLGNWPAQPSPSEARVQALSVVAAGGRGLMTFQTPLDLARDWPETWDALSSLNQDLRGIRGLLRVGAPTSGARADGKAIVEALRVPGGLVVVVIGLETLSGPTDMDCVLLNPLPWVLSDQVLAVEVDLPDDLGLTEAFEVLNGQVLSTEIRVEDRHARFTTATGEDVAGRIFVLASDPSLREGIEGRLGG